MKINFNEINLNIHTPESLYSPEKIPIIFLHGFTGSGVDWQNITNRTDNNFYPIAPDLIGHGESDSPDDAYHYTEQAMIEQLDFIISTFKFTRIILCGYSMGGRLALSYTSRYPEKVSGLILESTTAGISGETERSERRKNDELLAQKLLDEGVESFINYWMNIPLFSSLHKNPGVDIKELIKKRINNSAVGLANSLRGFGTGYMLDHWEDIVTFKQNTLLITGELDTKYSEINNKMKKKIQHCQHEIIKECGHNTHLEKPEEFFILVSSFIRTFIL